jgi:predicted PurR-regulated permease PerM
MEGKTIPFYFRLAAILLLLGLICVALVVARHVIMPLILSALFAILLRPVVIFLEVKLKFPPTLAVLLAVILFVVVILLIIFFISSQVTDFADDLPTIKKNLATHTARIKSFILSHFDISKEKLERVIDSTTKRAFTEGNAAAASVLLAFSGSFFNALLIPIYVFLILLNRRLFMNFLIRISGEKNRPATKDIIMKIKTVALSYISGLLIEMGIVSALTTIGMMIAGIPYPFLLGIIAGFLNMIPYLGNLIAGLIAIIVALANSSELSSVLGAFVVAAAVQVIDNNFLLPRIVANRVQINALVSIVAIIIGGAIAGIIGMFLAVPVVAVLKVIFDSFEELKPWGEVIGTEKTVRRKSK